MTLSEAKRLVAALGLTLRKTEDGEYRVNFRGGSEATAYCTNDLADAIATAKAMERDRWESHAW